MRRIIPASIALNASGISLGGILALSFLPTAAHAFTDSAGNTWELCPEPSSCRLKVLHNPMTSDPGDLRVACESSPGKTCRCHCVVFTVSPNGSTTFIGSFNYSDWEVWNPQNDEKGLGKKNKKTDKILLWEDWNNTVSALPQYDEPVSKGGTGPEYSVRCVRAVTPNPRKGFQVPDSHISRSNISQASSPQLALTQAGGLTRLTSESQGISVAMPQDLQEGDVVSFAVFKDEVPATEKYTVTLSSVVSFSDDEPVEEATTQPAGGDGLFTAKLPIPKTPHSRGPIETEPNKSTEIKASDSAFGEKLISFVLRDTLGKPIAQGTIPVKPSGFYSQPTQFGFPQEVETGTPVRVTGPFVKPVSATEVMVDQKPATIVAKSPRGVVVRPPEGISTGMHEWTVREGDKIASAMVNHRPGKTMTPSSSSAPSEKLPSQGIAVRNTEPAEIGKPREETSMCTEALSAYRNEMRSRVDTGWSPPKPPAKGEWVTNLSYDLLRTGSVTNIKVVKSSGSVAQDNSAIQRVSSMGGYFKPLPECYKSEALKIDHTFKVIYR